jgi:hypothetical protein
MTTRRASQIEHFSAGFDVLEEKTLLPYEQLRP